jgi:aquaporin Z
MRNPWNSVIAEIVGTFLFFFVGIGAIATISRNSVISGVSPDPSTSLIIIALAHGLALAVLVSALGAVSGAHFNPAVSFGVWISGQMPGRRAFAYIVAQLIGGLLAVILLRVIFPLPYSPDLGRPQLFQGVDPIVGVAIEAVLTAVLLFAVFGTATDPRGPKLGGLFIGLAVAADILMGGPLTGAAMNPARWFAPAAATGVWTDSVVWILGPLIGAAVAALAYRFFFLPEADLLRTPADPTA